MIINSIGYLTNIFQHEFRLQLVRFRRKPRWLPVAKSKMFRIPVHKSQDEIERNELLRLNNIYRTQMKSIRSFLHEDVKNKLQMSSADHLVLTPEQEEIEYRECLSINDEWNKQNAATREERLRNQTEKRREFIEERLELAAEKEIEIAEKIRNIVKQEKENSLTFIKKENLDEAIDVALANVIDYNRPIDIKDLKKTE